MAQPWECFVGSWAVDRSENFEQFLEAMGANFLKAKLAPKAPASIDVTVDGDKLTITAHVAIISAAPNTFHVNGDETDATFMDGEPFTAKTTFEDGKLIICMTPKGDVGKQHKITREIVDGELVQTMETGDVVAKRIMKKK